MIKLILNATLNNFFPTPLKTQLNIALNTQSAISQFICITYCSAVLIGEKKYERNNVFLVKFGAIFWRMTYRKFTNY